MRQCRTHRRRVAAGWLVVVGLLPIGLGSGGCTASMPPDLPAVQDALLEYGDSGRYGADLEAVHARARRWIERRATRVERPALVLDIDETTLLNWPYQREQRFRYDPDTFDAWVQAAEAPIAPGIEPLYRAARENGVAIFFITGRHEDQRSATEKNLREVGVGEWQRLYLRPRDDGEASASVFKTRTRREIESEGYTIIASIGDQESDLAGCCAEKTFKLPNPFYRVP